MKIAVLLPVFNCEDTINQTIDSILNQSYGNFCLYVINNNCNDSTIEKIKKFYDSRIKIFNFFDIQKCSAALNFGLSKIEEQYVARVDGDNVYHKDFLKEFVNLLTTTSYKIVYGSYIAEYEDRTEHTSSIQDVDKLIWRMLFFNTIDHIVMYKKDFIDKMGGYKELEHSEDYDLWVKCLMEDNNCIGSTSIDFIAARCKKSKKCMTEVYKQANNINIEISKKFIKNLLNKDISINVIKKIKNHEQLSSKDIILMNDLLNVFKNKRNIESSKILSNKQFFHFYV